MLQFSLSVYKFTCSHMQMQCGPPAPDVRICRRHINVLLKKQAEVDDTMDYVFMDHHGLSGWIF